MEDSAATVNSGERPRLLETLLDVLGVTVPARRALFERLMVVQARRRVPPLDAEAAAQRAFDYHATLIDAALGIVNAVHGGLPSQGAAPATAFDKSVLTLGFTSIARWTERLTCPPARHAARLMLSPEQMALLAELLQDEDGDDGRGARSMTGW